MSTSKAISEVVRADARRLHTIWPQIWHGTSAGLLILHGAATGALSWIVFTEPFPYPVMYPIMGITLWLFFALVPMARASGKTITAIVLTLFNLAMLAFWVAVIVDQVPGRDVALGGRLVRRPEMEVLYVPAAMYAFAGLALVPFLAIPRRR